MAVQTAANLANVMKEVWTASELTKQFYNEFPLLDRLEKTDRYTIGDHASVPLHVERAGATTTLGAAGGNLNPISRQSVNKGTYTLTYNWAEIGLEFGAINQTQGAGLLSVVDAKILEVGGAVDDMRLDVTRQALYNGDAIIGTVDATAGATTINGRTGSTTISQAITRGFLRPDQKVTIATSGNPDSVKSSQQIVTVNAAGNSGAGSFTVGSNVTNANDDIVYIFGARSGTAAGGVNDMLGLRSIYGSTTTTPGGIAASGFWLPAQVDTTTTAMTLDLPLSLQQNVFQQSGQDVTDVVTGIKQLTNLYKLTQSQVRFSSDAIQSAGNVRKWSWNGINIEAYPQALDNEFYFVDYSNMLVCTGAYSAPVWMSDVQGSTQGSLWAQGTTQFVDALAFSLGLAIRRRNTGAAAIALTA